MKQAIAVLGLLLLTMPYAPSQGHPPDFSADPDVKLPNGKSQRDELLKSDYEKSVKDAAELAKLADDLKLELEKSDAHVLSVNALKQLDSIEKLTKKIRSRMKRL